MFTALARAYGEMLSIVTLAPRPVGGRSERDGSPIGAGRREDTQFPWGADLAGVEGAVLHRTHVEPAGLVVDRDAFGEHLVARERVKDTVAWRTALAGGVAPAAGTCAAPVMVTPAIMARTADAALTARRDMSFMESVRPTPSGSSGGFSYAAAAA